MNLPNRLLPHFVEISPVVLLLRYSANPDYSNSQCPDEYVIQIKRTKICENKPSV